MLELFVGLIGWAKCLDRHARIRMGIFLLLAAIGVCILGSLISGTNVHGPFFLIFLPMFPISVMGLVLLIVVAISSGHWRSRAAVKLFLAPHPR
jgi:predicted membrane channel-forming protein YqfA (hemolysin III family)